MSETPQTVVIIGAGPASLYSASKLAKAGREVIIVNRDVKPGGLAEFGIYPTKTRMKQGLRTVFDRILSRDNVHYLGNITVGEGRDLTLGEIRDCGPEALVVAIGAQKTRWLGLPGEDADRVYHAKNLVYHFNALPPYSEWDFPIGDRVCVIGLGNVCLDIVHYMSCEKFVDSVTAVGRRGPAERKMTDRELKILSGALDTEQIRREVDRISPQMESLGQDPDEEYEDLIQYADEPMEVKTPTQFRFRFLLSPVRIATNDSNEPTGLVCEKTQLVPGESEQRKVECEGTGEYETVPCDTVVFAIGDSIDPQIGLPVRQQGDGYVTVDEPWQQHPDRPRYMVADPETGEPMWGNFVVGWAREASEGVVGKAKQDGEQGCDEVLAYLNGELERKPETERTGVEAVLDCVTARLEQRQVQYVEYDDVKKIKRAEGEIAEKKKKDDFKFETQEAMLDVVQ